MTRVKAGLCSITFRTLAAEEVLTAAADAGLAGIEWGVGLPVLRDVPDGRPVHD